MCKRLLVALGLLASAACTDLTGPPIEGPHDGFAALARVDGRAGVSVGDHVLEQAPSTPPLETYELSFWAVRGRASYVRIRYKGDHVEGVGEDPALERQAGGGVEGEVFLSLYIPWNALSRYPDGRRIRWWERVRITISVDPTDLYISFEPSGLVFNRHAKPWLYVSYSGANPDYDADGDVDRVDTYIEDNYLKLWRFDYRSGTSAAAGTSAPSGAWAAAGADASSSGSDPKKKSLLGKLGKLSDHAVSW